jgi:hypothetical protein
MTTALHEHQSQSPNAEQEALRVMADETEIVRNRIQRTSPEPKPTLIDRLARWLAATPKPTKSR